MLITKTVQVKVTLRNIKKIQTLIHSVALGDTVEVPSNLLPGRNENLDVQCDYCGDIVKVDSRNYFKITSDFDKYACSKKECKWGRRKEKVDVVYKGVDPAKEKRKQTNINKYGVEHTGSLGSVIDKRKQTNIQKYGVEHAWSSEEVKDKIKQTNLDKYGVEYTFSIGGTQEKIKKTNLQKYGVEYPFQSTDIQSKVCSTIYTKYGTKSTTQSDLHRKKNFKIAKSNNYVGYDVVNKLNIFKCDKGEEHTFSISKDNFFSRSLKKLPLCTVCNPIGDSTSIKQQQLYDFIRANTDKEVISNYRDGLELDIYIPDLNIGYEFNGLYWHSSEYRDKNYHRDKLEYFKDKGMKVIHVWEDDWDYKRGIIESQILYNLGLSNKIPARKTTVKIIDNKQAREFLDDNHLQGSYTRVTISLGLFFEDTLISVMTFDQQEGRKKMADNEFNLSRFCNLKNTTVVGGASKLFKAFTNIYNPQKVVSYADADWSDGGLYNILGFEEVYRTRPDYKYLIDGQRHHKSNFRKPKGETRTESQIMQDIPRIYDCGKIKYQTQKHKQ